MHILTALVSLAALSAGSVWAAPTKAPGKVVHLPMRRRNSSGHQKRDFGKPKTVNVKSHRNYYSADVEVGTPPQTIPVHLDTGSSELYFMSTECPEEFCLIKGRPTFDADKSSTAHVTQKNGTVSYASMAGTGLRARDVVSLAGFSAETPFLLVNNMTSNGVTSSGLMGLAVQPGTIPWWVAIKDQLAALEFSMFLGRTFDWNMTVKELMAAAEKEAAADTTATTDAANAADATGTSGGVEGAAQITFGGHDPELLDGDFNFVDADVSTWWVTGVDGLRINGQEVNIYAQMFEDYSKSYFRGKPSAMIDSGASLMMAPISVVKQIMDHIPGATMQADKLLSGATQDWWIPVERSDTVPGHSLEIKFGGEWYQPYFINYGQCVELDDKETQKFLGVDELFDLEYIRKNAPNAKEMCGSTIVGSEDAAPQYLLGDPFMQTVYMKYRLDPYRPNAASMGIGRLSAKARQMIDQTDAKARQEIDQTDPKKSA